MNQNTEARIGTLMLIDDNDIDQMLYKRIIDRTDIVNSVVVCESAEIALAKMKQGLMPDLILLDINMPRMNGFEFLEAAHEEFGTEYCSVVIMLTTSMSPRDKERADQYAVVKDYYEKPLTKELLEQAAMQIVQTER